MRGRDLGDTECIPFPDNEFAVVAAFNSLNFAVGESISPYHRDDGSYLLNNICYFLVATG